MVLFKNTKGDMCDTNVLHNEIEPEPFGYQMAWKCFKKWKGKWEEWLKIEDVRGYFICHLITNCGQSTHAVGLMRDGNGGGKIYDSIFQVFEFQCKNGFENFKDVFSNEYEKIVDFHVVAKVMIPKKQRKMKDLTLSV